LRQSDFCQSVIVLLHIKDRLAVSVVAYTALLHQGQWEIASYRAHPLRQRLRLSLLNATNKPDQVFDERLPGQPT
jgi:hypothetical protein